MAKGRVKWFNEKKGYGFISRDDGNDVFEGALGKFLLIKFFQARSYSMDKEKILKTAQQYILKGQIEKAVKEYQKVVKATPKDIRARLN